MGGGSAVVIAGRPSARRTQELTLVSTVLVCLALVMAVQLILMTVAIEGLRAGNESLLPAAAFGSGLCFAAACWLLRYAPRPTRAENEKGETSR